MDPVEKGLLPPGPDDLLPGGHRRCRATVGSTGNRCLKPAIPGGFVCRTHGGSTAHVQRRARLRLAELIDPAVAVLARIMADPQAKNNDRLRAVENILDRAGVVRRSDLDPDTARELLASRLAELLTIPGVVVTDEQLAADSRLQEIAAGAKPTDYAAQAPLVVPRSKGPGKRPGYASTAPGVSFDPNYRPAPLGSEKQEEESA